MIYNMPEFDEDIWSKITGNKGEKTMSDNDIIKALERCGIFGIYHCDSDCPMMNNGITNVNACKRELNIKAIELITRQKAKIEALEIINSTDVATTNKIREIAIKEFAERLKETKFKNGNDFIVYADNIDTLVKEMVGDGK